MSPSPHSIPRSGSVLPVAISVCWFKRIAGRPADDHDDYTHVITWADGSTEERQTIPREWNDIAYATHLKAMEAGKAKADATLAALASEHSEGRIGTTQINMNNEAA